MALLPTRTVLCASATARSALTTTSRAFTTTSLAAREIVPPQSPSYIRLPSPPQSEEPSKPRVRGQLPVPRDIFPRREGDRKIQPSYIQQTAPLPKASNEIEDPSKAPNKVREWKKKMASQRRENLESSLQSLWTRRQETDLIRTRRSRAKYEANKRALATPEREDDRITRSTVLDSLLDTAVTPDPDRFERAANGRANVEAIIASQKEARRDALMDLYMKASSFITNESDFKAEVEKVFAEDYFRKQATSKFLPGAADNAWDVDGVPTTVQEMSNIVMGTSKKPLEASKTESERTAERTMRIAEEFTGGKTPA